MRTLLRSIVNRDQSRLDIFSVFPDPHVPRLALGPHRLILMSALLAGVLVIPRGQPESTYRVILFHGSHRVLGVQSRSIDEISIQMMLVLSLCKRRHLKHVTTLHVEGCGRLLQALVSRRVVSLADHCLVSPFFARENLPESVRHRLPFICGSAATVMRHGGSLANGGPIHQAHAEKLLYDILFSGENLKLKAFSHRGEPDLPRLARLIRLF